MIKKIYVYNIVLKSNKKQVMATARSLKTAKQLLADIKRVDKELSKSYNWGTAPEYTIIKGLY